MDSRLQRLAERVADRFNTERRDRRGVGIDPAALIALITLALRILGPILRERCGGVEGYRSRGPLSRFRDWLTGRRERIARKALAKSAHRNGMPLPEPGDLDDLADAVVAESDAVPDAELAACLAECH